MLHATKQLFSHTMWELKFSNFVKNASCLVYVFVIMNDANAHKIYASVLHVRNKYDVIEFIRQNLIKT